MAITEQIGIVPGNKPKTLKWGAQARFLLSGYHRQAVTRERRRNGMGPGSFTKAKQEISGNSPSVLQVICQNRQAKKKAR